MLCRYEREFNHGKRPMLKAVLEQDHPATRPMVLCISAIAYKGDGQILHQRAQDQQQVAEQQQAVQSGGKQAQIQLTDGWYGVKAILDHPLTSLVQTGNLKLGVCLAAAFSITSCAFVLSCLLLWIEHQQSSA